MDDGDGAYPLELQAAKIMQNIAMNRSSVPCTSCGMVMNPVEFMYSQKGICGGCANDQRMKRIQKRMV